VTSPPLTGIFRRIARTVYIPEYIPDAGRITEVVSRRM
jgi:hypothetical protein